MKKKQIKEIDGVLTLCAGDIVCQCPLTAPWMIPGKLQGTASYTARACSEVCPLWDLKFEPLDNKRNKLDGDYNLFLCHNEYFGLSLETNEKQANTSIIGLSN